MQYPDKVWRKREMDVPIWNAVYDVRMGVVYRVERGSNRKRLLPALTREHVDRGNNQIDLRRHFEIGIKTQTHRQVVCSFVALRLRFGMWSNCYDLDGSHFFREIEMSKSKHQRNISVYKDRQ
jgi:hypothetical protein